MKLAGSDRSPNSTTTIHKWRKDKRYIERKKASGLRLSHLLVFGDLNQPNRSTGVKTHRQRPKPPGNSLYGISARDAFLTKHETEPIHCKGNHVPSTFWGYPGKPSKRRVINTYGGERLEGKQDGRWHQYWLWLCAADGVEEEDFTLAAPFTTYPLYTHIA